ncbi:hypothetical protein LCGC14_0224980 [marine sediment metagenome]|uniref:Uncharacterized protein n=1 Tax=marine sediment metagenome TaxID=412755 RepID=A0A0F9UGY4_9ZZZZ
MVEEINDNFYELKKLYKLLNMVEDSKILDFISTQNIALTIRRPYFSFLNSIKDGINTILNTGKSQ